MGFYGNITNQASTQFKFDKTYANRAEMDANKDSDGIYVGRYVLVEYGDGTLKQDTLTRGYLKKIGANNNAELYTSPNYEPNTRLYVQGDSTVTNGKACPAGTVVYVLPEDSGEITHYRYVPFSQMSLEPKPGDPNSYKLTNNYYTIPKALKQNKNVWTRVNSYANTTENQKKNKNIITKLSSEIQSLHAAYYTWNAENNIMELAYTWTDNEPTINLSIETLTDTNKGYWSLTNVSSYVEANIGDTYLATTDYLAPGRDTLYNTTVYFIALKPEDPRFVQTDFPFYENEGATISAYTFNYNVDITEYGAGRGYDSTVWQKVFENNAIKYVMIAELNAVVPTFDISADAPSLSPVTPHFDKDSTNVYYKVHWQPQWGMRVKSSSNYEIHQLDNTGLELTSLDTIDASTDETNYPSDATMQWVKYEYNPADGSEHSYIFEVDNGSGFWTEITSENEAEYEDLNNLGAAIYFNRGGFDSVIDHKATDETVVSTGWDATLNEIKIAPSGQSGHRYNKHDGTLDKESAQDIQEISVMLPGIGDAVSQMWDIVYGNREQNKHDDASDRKDINGNFVRNQDIAWRNKSVSFDPETDTEERLRLVEKINDTYEYNDSKVNTLAGCINSVHDLMGMVIRKIDRKGEQIDDENAIYYITANALAGAGTSYQYDDNGTLKAIEHPGYYRLHKYYTYTPVDEIDDEEKYTTVVLQEYQPNTFYIKEGLDFYLSANEELVEAKKYYSIIEEENAASPRYASRTFEKANPSFAYEPGLYYYPTGDNLNNKYVKYTLDNTPSRTDGRAYCTLNMEQRRYYFFEPVIEITSSDDNDEDNINVTTRIQKGFFYKKAGETNYTPLASWDEFDMDTEYYCGFDQLFVTVQHLDENDHSIVISTDNYVAIDYGLDASGMQYTSPQVITNDTFYETFALNTFYQVTTDGTGTICQLLNANPGSAKNGGAILECYPEKVGGNGHEGINETVEFYQPSMFYYCIKDEGADTYDNSIYYLDIENHTDAEGNNFILPDGRQYFRVINDPADITSSLYVKDTYYIKNEQQQYVVAEDEYDSTETYYKRKAWYVIEGNNIFNKGAEWNPLINPASVDMSAGIRHETWELQELKYFARTFNTIHGLLLRTRAMLEENDILTRDTATVQGSINTLNDIIAKFDELKPTELTIVDDYGRVHSAPIITTQTFGATNLGSSEAISIIPNSQYRVAEVTKATYKSGTYYLYNNDTDTFTKEANNSVFNNNATYYHSSADGTDRWINASVNSHYDSPAVVLTHAITKITDTTTQSDLNKTDATNEHNGKNHGNNNDIDLYTPIVDSTGHVVGHNIETVELPYGFKTISVENSTVTTKNTQGHFDLGGTIDAAENVASIIADNTQADMTVKSINRWIRLKTDANGSDNTRDDKANTSSILSIYHETHDFDTAEVTETNLNTEANSTLESNINIPDWTYDLAGHITGKKDHKYTLPYGFKTITTNGRATEVSENATSTPVTGHVVADKTQDSLAINSGNKWIRIDTKDTNDDGTINDDTITIRHDVHSFTSGAANTLYGLAADETVTTLDTNNTFEVPNFKFDEAGHITAAETHTVALPENFTTISVGARSTGTSEITATTGNIVADTLTDTLSLASGDRWIILSADTTNDKVTFGHAVPGAASTTSDADKVPQLGLDQTGHVSSVNEKHIGLFTLSEYSSTPTSVELTNDINASDTLHVALAKLQYQLNALDNATHFRGVVTALSDISDPANGDVCYVGVKEYIYYNNKWNEFGDETIYVTKAFATVDALSPNASETISSISQTNGKIAVSKQSIQIAESQVTNLTSDLQAIRQDISNEVTNRATGDSDTLSAAKTYTNNEIGKLDYVSSTTYNSKIQELEQTIAELTARIAALEPAE